MGEQKSQTIKIVIAGGREFTDYEFLKEKMNLIASKINRPIEVISGKARGVDTMGEDWAKENGFNIIPFPAKWKDLTDEPVKIKINKFGEEYNVLAGHNRNRRMAEAADCVVAFWDGRSTGTANMIKLAKEYKKPCQVFRYE